MEQWQEKALKMKENQRSFAYIAKHVNQPINVVKDFLHNFKTVITIEPFEMAPESEQKIEIDEKSEMPSMQNLVPEVNIQEWNGNDLITFGLMGDTQINSKYTQLTYLHQFYKICEQREIPNVYHTGDIDDGEQMRIGHQYECYMQGADDHKDEIVKNYPKINGITTHFITGNHDASIYKRCGMDIGKAIQAERPDMHYLGRDCAKIQLTPNCTLELRHPWDGTAYSLSYKPQKMMDGMEPDSKPNILGIGHYHKLEYLFYRNIHCFQTGCFQMQTPFTRGKGISVHLGGWIITVEVDKNGSIKRIIPEMIPFYKGIEDDYKNWL